MTLIENKPSGSEMTDAEWAQSKDPQYSSYPCETRIDDGKTYTIVSAMGSTFDAGGSAAKRILGSKSLFDQNDSWPSSANTAQASSRPTEEEQKSEQGEPELIKTLTSIEKEQFMKQMFGKPGQSNREGKKPVR